MRILFVNPPMPYGVVGHAQTPLGLCYLAAAVKDIAEVLVFDCNVSGDLLEKVIEYRPDIVGFSVLTATVGSATRLATEIRRMLRRECLLAAGGIHASTMPESVLRCGFDIVVRGEGERSWRNIVERAIDGEDVRDVRGVSYIREDGMLVSNPAEPLITDLDSLRFPHRDDLPWELYEHESVITSRGCLHNCFYCSSSHYWKSGVRWRSAANVLEELAGLCKSGRKRFYFCDDNFTANRELVLDLCRKIMESGLEIRWSALARADSLDVELLSCMKEAGCATLCIGVETGDAASLFRVKGTTLEQMKRAFAAIRECGIKIRATWMVGLGRSVEDEEVSLGMIRELLPDQVSIHCLIPFPNTDAWRHPEAHGILIDKANMDWDVMNMTYSPHILDYVGYAHISKGQVVSLVEKTRRELLQCGYDGTDRKLSTFLDRGIVPVLEGAAGDERKTAHLPSQQQCHTLPQDRLQA